MAFKESPAQRQRNEQKGTLFGLPPVFGPEIESEPGFPKSKGQQKRDDYKKAFFETKTLKDSSLKPTIENFKGIDPPRVWNLPVTGGKSKNEATGGTGSIEFIDCDGARTGYVEWEEGKIQTEGHQIIQGGCTPSSSYP